MSELNSLAVLVEKKGPVQWITINRPERRNAINEAVTTGIAAGIKSAMGNPEIRAVVLTGAGEKAFCAGGDLRPSLEGTPFKTDHSDLRHFVVDLFKTIEECTLPIIARVNGHALAGGLGLVCMCDLAIASDNALFGTPETKIGLFPATILTYMLRILPRRKLMEMCITGESFPANEALEMGLVNYTVPPDQLDEKVDWLLSRIVDKTPTGIRLGKAGLHAMQDMTMREALEYTQLLLPFMSQTEDAAEGMRAFQEKRPPNWTGR
ncbi:MAG: enoyl-CoA hydratase/isomerase family protein [Sneathiella sp.]|nr:enoyl-CoA hydratase/isomerase family protein [Sneathiella sp.]